MAKASRLNTNVAQGGMPPTSRSHALFVFRLNIGDDWIDHPVHSLLRTHSRESGPQPVTWPSHRANLTLKRLATVIHAARTSRPNGVGA
jgi:hypothetical protein